MIVRPPAGGAAGGIDPAPPAVPDAGRRALLIIGSRVAAFYQVGVVLGALLSPPRGHLAAWLAAVVLLVLCAVGAVAMLTQPVRPVGAVVFALSSVGMLWVLSAVHPSLSGRDTQVLMGSAVSAAAAGAALSWGPPAGLIATAGLLAAWYGPVGAVGDRADPSVMATALAGGILGTTGSAFLRRGYTHTQRALAAAEEAVATRILAAARWRARRHEIRVLHDTVLSTLSLVAQGGRGVDGAALRADCRIQAGRLREADARASVGPDTNAGLVPPAGVAPGPDRTRAPEPGRDRDLDLDHDAFARLRLRWAARSLDIRVYGTDEARGLAGVPASAASALMGAVEECLENVRRHAGVPVATVSVTRTGHRLQCTVTDEGRGFDPHHPAAGRIGLGDSVVGRIEEVGGEARVWSAPEQGTTVALWVPLDGGDAGCPGEAAP